MELRELEGIVQFSSVQSLSHVRLFATPWIAARQASLSITSSRSSLRLTSIESVMPSSHLILCRPLLLLPPIPLSIRVFSNESTFHMRWPKYWSFSFSIIPSKEIPGLISFRMDCLDLLAAQGTLKSLLQHHSSKASILWRSAKLLQGIVDYLKCYSKESVNSFSKGWKWLLRNSGESVPTALSFYFYAWERFWSHYSMFCRLLMHDSYTVQIGNGRDWYYGRGVCITTAPADHRIVWEIVIPMLIGSFRFLGMSL